MNPLFPGKLSNIAPPLLLFTLLLVSDRATKLWALASFSETLGGGPILSLGLRFNRGISFSFFTGYPSVGAAMAITAITLLALFCAKAKATRRTPGVIFLWAGAICNLLDRLLYGYVVDWFRVLLYMNLADLWLIAGALLVLRSLGAESR
ncbi:MAG: signal peptidase II [Synergistaceae bacterium]|jgi:signal peptidase II|nr:signal peptidase II [Synergistaceae bacterium]